ncbi:MAG: lipocalin family protein [Candidatus Marinimicrobia bacterium]|nr:lipocalin family protein [Candidatus Neomarinimicrobiota bacterium]
MKSLLLIALFFLAISLISSSGFSTEMKVVSNVDLQRYLGKWYEIATIPQRFQKGCVCVIAEYSLNAKGTITVDNSCHKGTPDGKFARVVGRAKVVPGSNNAKLRVSFFRPFWGDYWIVELDPDYQWAVVSNSKGSTCWILSRTRQMDEALYADIVERCRVKGIDVSRLLKTLQECGR